MPEDTQRLSDAFPRPSYEDWHKRVMQALRGRGDIDALVSRSYDGLEIRPFYRRADLPESVDPSGFPGFPPLLRGGQPDGVGWEVRQRHTHPDPAIVNQQILKDLERGSAAVTLAIDPEGRCGTVVRSKTDLAEALEGVDMTLAPVLLEAGRYGTAAAATLLDLWEEQGRDTAAVHGHLGLDPLGAWAAEGELRGALDGAFADLGTLSTLLAKHYPRVTVATVLTRPYHSAGASEAQELGAMLATGVAYLRAMEMAGLTPATAAQKITFTLIADNDLPLTIAKLRAARALWARVLEVCGIDGTTACVRIDAETAPRMLSRRDPWSNILRTTLAAFAAAAAGSDAITVYPHDAALGVPSDFARRIARNIQTILAEESHLGRVIDPAGGAYAFEALTCELAQRGWAEFQRIEGEGGMTESLAAGAIQARIAEVWKDRAEAIARRDEPVIGVSEYPDLGEAPIKTAPADPTAAIAKAEARAGTTQPADHGWSARIAASREGAALEALNPDGNGKTTIDPLPQHRLGEVFEALRDRSDTILAETGSRPRVFLACLGRLADHTARASWAQALYAAGGIEAVMGSGGIDPRAIAKEWRESGAPEVSICGPDSLYDAHLETVAKALHAAGASHLTLIGDPGERRAGWSEVGINTFAHRGIDCVTFLRGVYDRLGDLS